MLLKRIRSFVTALSCGALLASGLAVLAPSPANADALGDAIAAKAKSYIGQDHTMGPWNELWCGDFVKRVWTQEGVPAESWMSSFVPDWLQSKQYHNIGTYTPQPGDAVVWNDDNYNDSNGNPGSHISIVTSYANGLLSDVGGDQGGGKNPNNLTPPPPWWSTSHVNIDEDNGGTAYDPTKHLFPNTNYEMWVRGYISPGTGTPPPPTPATVDQVGTWNGSTVNTASPQSVSGTITLTATETKASRVLYYLDNMNPTGSSTPISSGDSGGGATPPHKLLFNTTSLANGSTHTITAAAFDATSTNQIDNTKTMTITVGNGIHNVQTDGWGGPPADAIQAVSVPIGTTGKNVTVVSSTSVDMARAGLDNAGAGDQVWIDRSWNGGQQVGDSQLGLTTAPGGSGWPTTYYNFDDPTGGRHGVLRACASTSAGITCTPWIGQICRNGTCDGTGNAPADAAQAVSVPIGTTGKNVTVITSNSTGLVRGGLDNASNGDQVWMDRSWDGSTDRSAFDSQIEKTTSTGGGWPTSWINSMNPDNNEPAAIRACASTSAGITCTPWIGQICRNGTCDGTGNAPADAAQAVSVPIGTTGKNVTVITSNSTGLVRGGLDNASNGDQVWMDRSWDGSTDRSAFDSQIEKTTSTGGGWPTSWINSMNPDNNEPAAIRACASTSTGITCTGWQTANMWTYLDEHSSITAMPNGDTQLVAYGLDHVLYHNVRLANGGWQGWAQVPGFGSSTFTGAEASIAGMPDGSAQIIAFGVDGNLYHCIRNADGSWQGWGAVGGVGTATNFAGTSPSITAMPNGDTQLVAYGLDHVLYHNVRLANGGWQGWAQVPGFGSSTFTGAEASIAGMPDGSAQIIAFGVDGNLYHCIRNADGSWQGWGAVGGVGTATNFAGTSPSITAMPNGDTQLVAYGLDHVLYHNVRLANGGWQGWAQVPGFGSSTFTGSDPTIAGSKTSNSAQIITVGVDHALYHCIRNPDGTWQGWAPIEGVGTGTTFQLG